MLILTGVMECPECGEEFEVSTVPGGVVQCPECGELIYGVTLDE